MILLTALRANENLRAIGERVMRAVSVRIGGTGDGVRLTASVGAVVCDDPNADAAAVLDAGDTAMYAAKRQGGGRLTSSTALCPGRPHSRERRGGCGRSLGGQDVRCSPTHFKMSREWVRTRPSLSLSAGSFLSPVA